MQTDSSQELEPAAAAVTIIPQNSFYKARLERLNSDSDKTCANIGILNISHDMRDVKFIRKLLSVKVVVRKLKFVENSRFLVRTIFHKRPVVKIKRILEASKVTRSNISQVTSRSCETTFSESVCLLANKSKVKVNFIDDQNIVKIVDMSALLSSVIYRLSMCPLSYLKPSYSEDDYGLGTYRDIIQDDADRPRKVIPEWALEDRVKMQMVKQARTDTDKIFAPRDLNVSDLSSMFPDRPRAMWENPWCDSPSPKKTARGKENESKGKKKLRL